MYSRVFNITCIAIFTALLQEVFQRLYVYYHNNMRHLLNRYFIIKSEAKELAFFYNYEILRSLSPPK
jgi:hypothetical protein